MPKDIVIQSVANAANPCIVQYRHNADVPAKSGAAQSTFVPATIFSKDTSFQHLARGITKNHPSPTIFLLVAWKLDFEPLANEILNFAVRLHCYDELLQDAITNSLEAHNYRFNEAEQEILQVFEIVR